MLFFSKDSTGKAPFRLSTFFSDYRYETDCIFSMFLVTVFSKPTRARGKKQRLKEKNALGPLLLNSVISMNFFFLKSAHSLIFKMLKNAGKS